MFIHVDIVIICDTEGVPARLVTALWVPDHAQRCGGW